MLYWTHKNTCLPFLRAVVVAFLSVCHTHAVSHTCPLTHTQTRSQQQGAPLKKPGLGFWEATRWAYNTDAYYQAKDEGFGDVGVGQVR
eukprot:1161784-Pelagomonas_calceolata.AAC.3